MADTDDFGFEPATPEQVAAPSVEDDFGFEPVTPEAVQPAAPPVASAAPEQPAAPAGSGEDKGILGTLWDYNPARAAYEAGRLALTGKAPTSALGKAVLPSSGTVQAFQQGQAKGAALGTNTLQDYAGAVGDQIADTFDSSRSSTFDESLEMVRANRKAVAEQNQGAATAGEIVGGLQTGIASGGGVTGLAEAAAPQLAKSLAAYAGKGLLQRASVATGVLLAEGAAQGEIVNAARELDQAVERKDFKGVGERIFAAAPPAAIDGALTNLAFGGAFKVGALGVSKAAGAVRRLFTGGVPVASVDEALDGVVSSINDRARAIDGELDGLRVRANDPNIDPLELPKVQKQISDLQTERGQLDNVYRETVARAQSGKATLDQLAVKTANKAAPPPVGTIEAAMHDPVRPLRARDLEDAGDDVARAARANVDPETAAAVKAAALDENETIAKEMFELEAGLDYKFRVATKNGWAKELNEPWRGPSPQEILNQAGLTDEMLANLERRSAGEGATKVAWLREKIKDHLAEITPAAPAAKQGLILRAPMPGQRLQMAQPALGDNPYQNISELGGLAKSLEAAKAPVSSAGAPRAVTLGDVAVALDQIKRDADKVGARSVGLVHEKLLNPIEALKLNLEDQATFGKFAEAQKPINAVWTYDINTSRSPLIKNMILEGNVNANELGGDRYDVADVLNRKALAGHMDRVGMPDGAEDQIEEALKRRLRARELSYSERMAWAEKDPSLAKDVGRYSQLRKQFEDNVNKAALANRALAARKADPTLLERAAGTGITGTIAKHVKDKAAMWATDRAADASGAAFGLKAQAAKVQERVAKIAKKAPILTKSQRDTVERAVRVVPTVQQVQKVLEAAEKYQDESSEEQSKLQSSLQKLESALGPEMATAYADQVGARADFLLEKAGPKPTQSVFGGAPKRVLDDETAERMGRYIDAADDPVAALERIGAGEGTSEDHETLETLYPGMLQDFKSKAVAALAESKKELDYDQQLAIAQALRIPLTPEQDTEAQVFWQTYAKTQARAGAEEAMAKQAARRMPKLGGEGKQSRAERLG